MRVVSLRLPVETIGICRNSLQDFDLRRPIAVRENLRVQQSYRLAQRPFPLTPFFEATGRESAPGCLDKSNDPPSPCPIVFMMFGTSLVNFLANSGAPQIGVKMALVLFEVFVVLMVVFVLYISFMVMRRWFRRQHRQETRVESNLPDPWKEAANRIEPFDKS